MQPEYFTPILHPLTGLAWGVWGFFREQGAGLVFLLFWGSCRVLGGGGFWRFFFLVWCFVGDFFVVLNKNVLKA